METSITVTEQLQTAIRDVVDFPKKGIVFKDITPLLQNPELLKLAIGEMAMKYKTEAIDQVVGIESRGFIFGAPLALKLGAGFVPVRKKGKLPAETKAITYSLEYGEDTLEIHADAISKGTRVLISDDLLATGGTASAVCELVENLGGTIVGVSFLIDLTFLNGMEKLKKYIITKMERATHRKKKQ